MHLNQLSDYLGRSQELIITKTVNEEELKELLLTRVVDYVIRIKEGTYVALMKGNLKHKLIKQLNF